MKTLSKFTAPELNFSEEFSHPNLWQLEEYESWSRLTIGAEKNEIPLILELCKRNEGQFGILWVLLASRVGNSEGRYQSPSPINYEELELFLCQYQEFFEHDGRHHLWVMSLSDDEQYIYDNHNVVHTYGNLDLQTRIIESLGFKEGEIRNPVPHTHNYHAEYDDAEDKLMKHWEWKRYPLEASDDP